ncbi:hypothetical protein CAL29_21895 [Bordetella genomosp. 10]|uniref:Iron dicitrate transport regulator FecR n=1 Tax=Bordetella genomosp. 10 TaxID=1416804 RepID=A0A261S131_9BORD|nr:FecR family protein [Bordetella genomosp. 10]OZI30652.1 hypothetical protein CAL29_21895 [Bordetella genomosp. 10]
MTATESALPSHPRDAAAYWFARVHSGNFSAAEQLRFQQWRQAAAAHEHEYRALENIWRAAGELRPEDVEDLLQAPEPGARRSPSSARRAWLASGMSLCALAAAGGFWGWQQRSGPARYAAEFSTRPGERRRETLPDGSTLDINTRSRVTVRYFDRERHVALAEGEVMFLVAKDTARPFIVDAGAAAVRVTGTEFDVRREGEDVGVTVQSGSVEVTTGHWWRRERVALTAGLGAGTRAGQALPVDRVDVAAVTAWRQGKVVFKDRPLQDVVAEMNRYLEHPIHIADSRLARLSMAGVFSTQDGPGFLQALAATLPVSVRPRADGGVDLAYSR